jgi:PhnB protein
MRIGELRRCGERELADSLRDQSNVIGGWLPPLTFAYGASTGGHMTNITATLSVRDGAAAIEFYKAAFGATEQHRVDAPDGSTVCQLSIEGAEFWVSDESPSHLNFSPDSLGGCSVRMLLMVDDPDAVCARAVSAGATQVVAVEDGHGWRLGRIQDPFGHHWEVGRPPP